MTAFARPLVFSLVLFLHSPGTAAETLTSPDGRLKVSVLAVEDGPPTFDVSFGGVHVATGKVGIKFAGSPAFRHGSQLLEAVRASRDKTYAISVGKTSAARDQHNELMIQIADSERPGRRLDLVFRAFNDGVAFRYAFPAQESLAEFVIEDELTQFSFDDKARATALPLNSYTTPYEKYYEKKTVGELSREMLIGLPMMLECRGSGDRPIFVAVTEANLTDYAGLYLQKSGEGSGTFVSKLSPLPGRTDGAKVLGKAPFVTPWRVLMIADSIGRLIESNILFNLSEPAKIEDASWIKPGQTTFPWWNGYVLDGVDFKPGVNTATMKHYIDFCAEQGIPYHSLDGIDIAWYGGPIQPKGPTDVTKAAPSIDMPELLKHAKEKGVRLRLWMHWRALEPQLDEAFATYEEWGVEGVMIDFMDRDDQEMVRWYHEVAEKAAKHRLTVTWHGAYKPTGMERTWPNVLTYEAALNQEYNKWQPAGVKGTPPEHNLDIAFVRMLAGPLDYHQGGMRNVLPENYQFRDKSPPVQGTRGHQLAMYIVYQNHLPMVADSPSAYRGQLHLDFLFGIPANWDETRVLVAEMGRCLVIARRKGEVWYLGGMTGGEGREVRLPLGFLGKGPFGAELLVDHSEMGPMALSERKQAVASSDTLEVAMPASGGFAGRVVPKHKGKPGLTGRQWDTDWTDDADWDGLAAGAKGGLPA